MTNLGKSKHQMWQFLITLFHRIGSPPWFMRYTQTWPWVVGIVGIVIGIVGSLWGLAFAPTDYLQGNSYRIIFIHVPSAFLAQSAYLVMGAVSIAGFVWRVKLADKIAEAVAPIGAWFTVLALFTGAIWGKPTWGTFWIWDARITTMFILLLLYLGIILLRRSISNPRSAAAAVAILTIIGLINIPLIKYSVDWWFTLHQPASLKLTEKPSMPLAMLVPLLTMILAFYLVFFWLVIVRVRTLILQTARSYDATTGGIAAVMPTKTPRSPTSLES